jgi:hypothetical protein
MKRSSASSLFSSVACTAFILPRLDHAINRKKRHHVSMAVSRGAGRSPGTGFPCLAMR